MDDNTRKADTAVGLKVRDLMTRNVYAAGLSDNLATVSDLMDSLNVRHLPVVDRSGDFVGLITARDFTGDKDSASAYLPLSEARQWLESRSVSEIITEDPPTTDPDEDLVEAGRTILENKLGCLPVVEGSRLVGILTEADFVRFIVEHPRAVQRAA
jgi:CBS domain-containing membrane protein